MAERLLSREESSVTLPVHVQPSQPPSAPALVLRVEDIPPFSGELERWEEFFYDFWSRCWEVVMSGRRQAYQVAVCLAWRGLAFARGSCYLRQELPRGHGYSEVPFLPCR